MKTLIIIIWVLAIVINLVAFIGKKIVARKYDKLAEERKRNEKE